MSNQHNPVFPAIELPQFIDEKLPNVVRARLHHPKADALPDVAAATVDALKNSAKLASLPAGARVAITCGSRGIKSKPAVVKATVSWLKERGFQPFIVPAMGSHGGARAESQVVLLGELGYTEEAMGCPIHSSMEVVQLGKTSLDIQVSFDKYASQADAIVVINRIKAHTSFDREVESGLTKMVAIGLGKAEGARLIHRLGTRGYLDVLPEWAGIAIEKAPITFGIGIVENAEKDATIIEGVEDRKSVV